MVRTAVLVSGGGTNLGAIIEARRHGELPSTELALVVSSRVGAYALERAKAAGIETATLERRGFENRESFCDELLRLLSDRGIEFVVLAGFMCVLTDSFTQHYPKRIINVHPSLIPSFCGDGFYGLRVHRAVLDYGVKVTGATVHFVNETVDGGEIILQRAVCVNADDTPQILQERVMREAEHVLLPKAIEDCCREIMSGRVWTHEAIAID